MRFLNSVFSRIGSTQSPDSRACASLFEIAQVLLSKPLFWERWRSLRIRVNSDERTDKIQILSGSLMSDIKIKERSKNG